MTTVTESTSAESGALRRSPLEDRHEALGATFTEFAGWRMPLRYSSELAEHAAVRTAAGLFDLSHMGEIVVIGPGAAAALDIALLGEVSAMEAGRARYTLLLTGDGGIVDDLIVYRMGADRYMVVANASNREEVAEELRSRAVGFDATVQDETDDIALIALQGPISQDVLVELSGFEPDDDVPTTARFHEQLASLGDYRFLRARYAGRPVLIARTGYTGELGYELFASPDLAARLWDAILAAGAGSGVVPAGLAARDTLRLEAGMPLFGHELTAVTMPAEVGLGRLVKATKRSDYVGRDAVAQAPGPRTVLIGLVGEGKRAARAGYPVRSGGRTVGVVTSGALSPTLGVPIAMASVEPAAADQSLTVDVRGSELPVRVVPLPFYRRKG